MEDCRSLFGDCRRTYSPTASPARFLSWHLPPSLAQILRMIRDVIIHKNVRDGVGWRAISASSGVDSTPSGVLGALVRLHSGWRQARLAVRCKTIFRVARCTIDSLPIEDSQERFDSSRVLILFLLSLRSYRSFQQTARVEWAACGSHTAPSRLMQRVKKPRTAGACVRS
jgi:hypothetical protein